MDWQSYYCTLQIRRRVLRTRKNDMIVILIVGLACVFGVLIVRLVSSLSQGHGFESQNANTARGGMGSVES